MNRTRTNVPKFDTKDELRKYLERHYLSHDAIAAEAYSIWEKTGRPDGDELCNPACPWYGTVAFHQWTWARMKLEIALEMDTDTIWWMSHEGQEYSDLRVEP